MCKKVLIAAVAVVAGLAVVSSTRLGSYARLKWQRATSWCKKQIPLEDQIARLRIELNDLQKDDDKHFDKVARQEVEVARRERELTALKADVAKQEAFIRQMRQDLASAKAREEEFVTVAGSRYSLADVQEQIRTDFVAFEAAEQRMKSREAQLKSLKRSLAVNKQKLKTLEKAREEMKNDLIRLETALAEQRTASAQSSVVVDDSKYSRLRKEIEDIRDEIAVREHKLKLRGQSTRGPIKAAQEAKERESKLDRAIDARFGNSGDKKIAHK
jgi:chromosome segregation ATPase